MTWFSFFRRRRDPLIDSLIKPPTYVYTGHQEDLAVTARQRRARAETIRREALLVDTRDDMRSKLTRVK